jgi:hypothetical protein
LEIRASSPVPVANIITWDANSGTGKSQQKFIVKRWSDKTIFVTPIMPKYAYWSK